MKTKNTSQATPGISMPMRNPDKKPPMQETKAAASSVTSTSEKETNALDNNNYRFRSNSTYFTICIYGLAFVALATIIFITIYNWNNTVNIFHTILGTLTPFVIAFFIAYILNPFVKWIDQGLNRYLFRDRFTKGRKLTSIGIAYLLVLSFIIITILYITPELLKTVKDIDTAYSKINIPELERNINQTLSELQNQFPFLEFSTIENKINELLPHLFSYGTSLITNVLSISVSIVRTLINILLSIVISCYMLADKNSLNYNTKRVIYAVLPKSKATYTIETLRECNSIFSNFIIGKSLDSLIIGIICFILMNILRLDYALLFSLIVGITNMIPYFGPFIGAVPGIIIYLFIDPVQTIIFAIMIFALQQFDGLYLGPKILGGSTGLTPLWVIFGITVGGAYGGVFGMFLGVPITAVIAYLLNKSINNSLKKKKITL